mmetsp:Transcript_10062/g.18097  ORF Transcript_10062/g.18097 Transcript_10062/m.18097 type:complete len:190 (+) Transcript_10062:156-725(+)
MNSSSAINKSRKGAKNDESSDWARFSSDQSATWSDSSDDDASCDEASVGGAQKAAAGKTTSKTNEAKAATKAPGNKENNIPRKAPVKGKTYGKNAQKIPRKVLGKIKNTIAGGFKFGDYGGHQGHGGIRSKSPAGRPMVLSRRLSRRITRGSPLRSPIVACQLDFSFSALKEKKSKGTKKRPPRVSASP